MSKSKAKGTAWETAVVRYLQDNGFPDAERRVLAGANDKGDVRGVPRFTLELKDEKALSFSQYLKEAEVEAVNAGTPYYAAVVKRRQKGVADGYVVLPLHVFVEVLREMQGLQHREGDRPQGSPVLPALRPGVV